METILKTKINEWKTSRGLPPYAEKTINKYITDIRKLAPKDYEDMTWCDLTKQISEKLKDYKPTTQRNYYNSLLIGIYASGHASKGQGVAKIYEAKRDMLNAQYENKGGTTDKQQEILKNVNVAVIDAMLETMSKDLRTRHTHMVYVMIQVYKRFAFRNDVAGMEIFLNDIFDEIEAEERHHNNYLVLGKPPRAGEESMSFVLNDYKTARKYGEKVFEVEDAALKDIILQWIYHKVDGDWKQIADKVIYLFDWATGSPLTRNDISHALSDTFMKYTGYPVSTTLLRKIYSKTIFDPNGASDEEINEVIKQADISGHGVKMKAKVYHV